MEILITGGKLSPYLSLQGGIDFSNIMKISNIKGQINPFKLFDINAYGNIMIYTNQGHNLNFDDYKGSGLQNSYNFLNLGVSHEQSASFTKNKLLPTNSANSYGISLSIIPSLINVTKTQTQTYAF